MNENLQQKVLFVIILEDHKVNNTDLNNQMLPGNTWKHERLTVTRSANCP